MDYVVGIADMKVSKNPSNLVTVGLGSCIGIVLHDPLARVGALIHAMLPSVKYSRSRGNPAKFVDTAVPKALDEMVRLGATKGRVTAILIGGAKMFSGYENGAFIGDRNVEAAKKVLKKHGVRVTACDIGGDIGRTVKFNVTSGQVLVKTAMKGTKEL